MSLILSGPKRIYVLLLFWQRLADPCAACPRSLVRLGQALGTRDPAQSRCGALCRIVVTCRLSRIFWRHLIGLSLFVLDSQP